MDILYYSNYCKHSQKLIQFLAKSNFSDKFNFVCIDNRKRDPLTNQINITLENGKTVLMPPNIYSVPALLMIKQNFKVVLGDDIMTMFQSVVDNQNNNATGFYGEPASYQLGGSSNCNIMSENYTYYNMTPEELSAKGKGGMRQTYNYVLADHSPSIIHTPDDTYKPDKISNGVTIDSLQQKRNEDIKQSAPNPFYI
jgi:hypothetical protein